MALTGSRQWMRTPRGQKKLCYSTIRTATAKAAAYNKYALTGEFAPVYVVMGFVSVAIAIGAHTAKQQLVHAPAVNITKRRRESVPEVDIPDVVTSNGDKFINKSFLRKVAHIQHSHPNINPYIRSREAETLQTIGVTTRGH